MTLDNTQKAQTGDSQVMLRERELAERWKMSQRTLQRWRAEGFGPSYIVIGGSIRYRMANILAFEDQHCLCGRNT